MLILFKCFKMALYVVLNFQISKISSNTFEITLSNFDIVWSTPIIESYICYGLILPHLTTTNTYVHF